MKSRAMVVLSVFSLTCLVATVGCDDAAKKGTDDQAAKDKADKDKKADADTKAGADKKADADNKAGADKKSGAGGLDGAEVIGKDGKVPVSGVPGL